MKENIIRKKSFYFAIRIIKIYKSLLNKNEYVLSKQLLRSGTAAGAMISEAKYAESRADFIHKLAVAQKEINETIYWLELLMETNYLTLVEFRNINKDAIEIIKLITTIIQSMKNN